MFIHKCPAEGVNGWPCERARQHPPTLSPPFSPVASSFLSFSPPSTSSTPFTPTPSSAAYRPRHGRQTGISRRRCLADDVFRKESLSARSLARLRHFVTVSALDRLDRVFDRYRNRRKVVDKRRIAETEVSSMFIPKPASLPRPKSVGIVEGCWDLGWFRCGHGIRIDGVCGSFCLDGFWFLRESLLDREFFDSFVQFLGFICCL